MRAINDAFEPEFLGYMRALPIEDLIAMLPIEFVNLCHAQYQAGRRIKYIGKLSPITDEEIKEFEKSLGIKKKPPKGA